MYNNKEANIYHQVVNALSNSHRRRKASMSSLNSLMTFLVLVTLMWLGLSIGCQVKTAYPVSKVTFEELCGLTSEQIDKMDQTQASQWLEQRYGVISASQKDGVRIIRAENLAKGYMTIILLQDKILEVQREIKNGPSFGQIVVVFGTPQSIYGMRQIYELISFSVGMDYPMQGLSVYMSKKSSSNEVEHNGRLEVQLNEDYIVDQVKCYVAHSSMVDILHNRYSSNPATLQYELNRRKPWGGFGGWVTLEP